MTPPTPARPVPGHPVEHRLTLLDGDKDNVIPGIHARAGEGHTLGQQFVVAWLSATSPFRKPGAETVRQMPGFCVRNPAIDAA